MANFVGGVQGSGKTYYMVDYIWENYMNYEHIYTNIDNLKIAGVKKLDMADLKKEIAILYEAQTVNNASDKEVLKMWGKGKSLYIIDEAHNFFNKSDEVWLWLITYHRHLDIDLFLLSQNISLIHISFRIFNEYVVAYPPVKQFSKDKIRYTKYISYPFKSESNVGDFKIKKEDRIFKLYTSGGTVKSSSVLPKFFIMGGIMLFVSVGLFYWLIGGNEKSKQVDTSISGTSVSSPGRHGFSPPSPSHTKKILFIHFISI